MRGPHRANMAVFHAAVDGRFAEAKTDTDAGMAALRAEFANEFKALYRHLGVMGAGIVAVTVMLVKLVP